MNFIDEIKTKKLILFGASQGGNYALDELEKFQIKVDYFCDNSKEKWGDTYKNVKIISPVELIEISKTNNVAVLITSMYSMQISKQLQDLGMKDFYILLNFKGEMIKNIYKFSDINRELSKNKIIKNSCIGKRAFILATGPSIKKENLKLLEGEDCFSISNFFLHKDINIIKPKYQFFIPYHKPLILNNYIEWLKYADSKLPKETEMFLEYRDKNLIEENKIFINRKIHYLYFSQYASEEYVDITKSIISPQTGPLMIIPVLLYMGYSNIYLLGCDHNTLKNYRNTVENFYSKNEDVRKNATSQNCWASNIIEQLEAEKRVFVQYDIYKKMININSTCKIVNLSRGSWLDLFEFSTLEEVKERGQNK